MNEQMQALCFLAGANSIFYGEKLLTTDNPMADADRALFKKLGIHPEPIQVSDEDEDMAQLMEQIQAQKDREFFYDASR